MFSSMVSAVLTWKGKASFSANLKRVLKCDLVNNYFNFMNFYAKNPLTNFFQVMLNYHTKKCDKNIFDFSKTKKVKASNK